jgi:putative endonuclease
VSREACQEGLVLHLSTFVLSIPPMSRYAFVYILRCADGSLYTGYTIDLDRRLRQHRSGNGGRYTRSRVPVELVYSKKFRTRREAMQQETAIKQLPRSKKLLLIAKGIAPSKVRSYPRSRDRSRRGEGV